MSSELFEAMENQGLTSGNKVNLNNVKKTIPVRNY